MPSEDLYPPSGGTGPPDKGEAADHSEADESSEQTALLPKSILAGKDFKPGEEVVLKIVRIHDDEVEVAYATEKPETENKSEGMSADEEIDSMTSNPKGY